MTTKIDSIENIPLEKCGDEVLSAHASKLINFFILKTGEKPDFIVKCPGRVNLIGEHIDYCGYPVFPMAIEKYILVAVKSSTQSPAINLYNSHQKLYEAFTTEWAGLQVETPPTWKDYVLCGIKGVHDLMSDNSESPRGLTLAVDGNVPPSSGLSSSSAVVCSSAVATWHSIFSRHSISPSILAHDCAKFERMIGTAGGGMDQAIQFLARKGSASYVQFQPHLSYSSINLPSGGKFYISHSGISCNKGSTNYFNTRVFETRIAASILAVSNELPLESFEGEVTLFKMQNALKLSLQQMIMQVEASLTENSYSLHDILSSLKCNNLAEILELISVSNHHRLTSVINFKSQYKIRQRALHVFHEALRVESFKDTCISDALSVEEKLLTLGRLMNESHESCANLYDCSCPELNSLVTVSRNCGAIGSRLTGAGWGGCTISLVRSDDSLEYERKMREHYPEDDFTFNTRPSGGIAIYSL